MSELHHVTIAEAARLIQARKLSPVELTQAYLRRIEALDAQINAFITLIELSGFAGCEVAK